MPEGGPVRGHESHAVRQSQRDERLVLGRRHQAQGRDGQVDGLPGDVLQQAAVPVRQVQTFFQRVSDHV